MKKSIIASLICLSAPAYGQDQSPEPVQTSSDRSSGAFIIKSPEPDLGGEIIVTATRQAEPEQAYAGSISVIGPNEIDAVLPVHPAEILNQVSGVNIHRGSGQEHLTAIRSPVLTGGAGAGSFLYLEDGIPLRAAGFANVNGLFEGMEELAGSMEVVKGPGSVLYGSNAVHGLVNIISAAPENGGRIHIMGSDDGYARVMGQVGTDSVSLGLTIAHDNGFREESGFDQQKLQLRVDETIGDWDAVWVTSLQNLNQETAGFIQGAEAYKDEAIRFTNPFPEAFRDGRSARTYLRLQKDVGDEQRLSITPYARWTDLKFLRHFVPGQALEKNGHKSIGLQSTLYGKNYVIGFDGEYTDGFLDEFQHNPSRFSFIQGAHYDYSVKALTLAGYGQFDVSLGPDTQAEIGARLEYSDFAYDNKIDSGVFGRFRRVDDRSDDFWAFTPKLALTHSLNDEINLYGRLARGARSPQTSDLYSVQINQLPGDAKVETLDSAEIGLKARLAGVSVNVAAFAMAKDNFFFRNADGFNVTNGQTDHIGIEADFSADLTSWLSLSGSGTLARHRYNFDDPASNIIDGNRVDTAPDTMATLRAIITPVEKMSAGLEWRHMGSYFTNPGNSRTYPGHDIFVARTSYDISDDVRVFGRIDNLFDEKYADRADFAFGNERYFPGRPRTLFFGVETNF